ncbi:MAG: 3-dehydroquinate synthase [Planctomycetota bacterium]|jgi:3-dehydroquinate synthase
MSSPEKIEAGPAPIFFGNGCLADSAEWAFSRDRAGPRRMCAIVTDSNVAPRYRERVQEKIEKGGAVTVTEIIPPGEEEKTPETTALITERFASAGLGRDDFVVGLGGGVVTDIAGFAAAVYMRGIEWWSIPTTLLGQVDAGIGGKTGVDLMAGKNLFGAFHQPSRIIIDPSVIETLPERHFAAGLAEVAKYGFISDPEIFKPLELVASELTSDRGPALADAIRKCAVIKSEIVSEDEKESGGRAILNYGHTISHGLEAAAGYEDLLHGEALVFGMIGAAMVGVRQETCGADILDFTTELFEKLPVRRELPALITDRVMSHIEVDKKRRGGELRFVLPVEIGKVTIEPVERKLVYDVVSEILEKFGPAPGAKRRNFRIVK